MTIPTKLTITLTPNEGANLLAWIEDLLRRPDMIGKTPDGYVPGTNLVNGQSKNVLEDTSANRFWEIAAQFGVEPPHGGLLPGYVLEDHSLSVVVPGGAQVVNFRDVQPGVVYTYTAGATGNFTWSHDGGGMPVWASSSTDAGNQTGKNRQFGVGTTQPLLVMTGQKINIWSNPSVDIVLRGARGSISGV